MSFNSCNCLGVEYTKYTHSDVIPHPVPLRLLNHIFPASCLNTCACTHKHVQAIRLQTTRSGEIKSFWELVWSGGVQTNGCPDVCVFVCTGDHVWVCARGMGLYFESENDCVSVPWRRKSLVSVSSSSIQRTVYASIYLSARAPTHTHTHTHIPYINLCLNWYHIVRPSDCCWHE